MGDELLALYCSPVFERIKPSNLFSLSNYKYDVDSLIRGWNKDFNKYGIYFKILSTRARTSSIFCFREDLLNKFINTNETKCFLKSCGYDTNSIDICTDCLKDRLCQKDFPHEIGLLLGYPYEDVMGFIENQGKNYLCSGYWKVYKDKDAKCKIFTLYNQARLGYLCAIRDSTKILELVEKNSK